MITLKKLDTKHPEYDAAKWCELDALVSGGDRFRGLIRTFLPQSEYEPHEVYAVRSRDAHYVPYLSSIVGLYSSWLFMGDLTTSAYERDSDVPIAELDPVYGRLSEDVGGETSLADFAKERLSAALTTGASHWLVQLPSNGGTPPRTLAEYEARSLGDATLTPVARAELVDWCTDDEGCYTWVLLHTVTADRPTFLDDRDLVTETWSLYDATTVTRFALSYTEAEGRPASTTEVPIVEQATHGFASVPLVSLTIPAEITLGEQLRDTALECFRLACGLSWSIHRSCYPVPVFKSEDGEDSLGVMGPGYVLRLGKDQDFSWKTPPDSSFETIRRVLDSKRVELYRVASCTHVGLADNAEVAGRSAESKAFDENSSRMRVEAYATCVSRAIEETFEILSEARGDTGVEWHVDLTGYDTTSIPSLLTSAQAVKDIGIESPTLVRELSTKIANGILGRIDQRLKNQIRKEIAGITEDDLAA